MMGNWKPSDHIGVGLIVIMVLGIVYWGISNFINLVNQEEDLVKRQFSGVLVSIKQTDHGYATIVVKQHGGGDQLTYDLDISYFIRQNMIKVNDSISKEAGSHTVTFYKRVSSGFEKCCEWEQ